MLDTYTLGQPVRVDATFDDKNPATPAPDEPGTVTLRVKDPTGAVTVHLVGDLAHDTETGEWSYVIDTNIADGHGRWTYRWEGADGLTAVGEQSFYVLRSRFTEAELAAT